MWLAGGLAVVAGGVLVVALAFLEDETRRMLPTSRGIVTAEELRAAELPVAWRGYSRGHVDALLARAATTLEDARHYGLDADEATGPITREGVDRTPGPAEPPSFLRDELDRDEPDRDEPEPNPGLGEELEDRRSDDTGRLDR